MRNIKSLLKHIIKSKDHTAALYITISALLCLALAHTENPLSGIERALYHGLSFGRSSRPTVTLVEPASPETPVTVDTVLSAVGCALHNGAESVVLIASDIRTDYANAAMDALISGEAVHIDQLLGTSSGLQKLKRIIAVDDTIHLSLPAHRGSMKIDTASGYDKLFPLPQSGYRAGFISRHDDLIPLADSFVPLDAPGPVPVSARIGEIVYPHAALAAAAGASPSPVSRTWYGLLVNRKGKRTAVPLDGGRARIHHHDSMFTRSGITRIPFSDTARFYNTLMKRDSLFTALAEEVGHPVYDQIAAARRSFLYNSFPFVPDKSGSEFFQMYKAAESDATAMEEVILQKAERLLGSDDAGSLRKKTITSIIRETDGIDSAFEDLGKMDGTVCVISVMPHYTDMRVSPGYQSAALLDSILQKTVFAQIPLLLSLITAAAVALLLYNVYTGNVRYRLIQRPFAVFGTVFILQLLFFFVTRLYISVYYVQGLCLLAWGAARLEAPVRSFYRGSVALRYGTNLPSGVIGHIASNPYRFRTGTRHDACILECRLSGVAVPDGSGSLRSTTQKLTAMYEAVAATADRYGGIEMVFDADRFRYCFIKLPGGSGNPVDDAVEAALHIESVLDTARETGITAGTVVNTDTVTIAGRQRAGSRILLCPAGVNTDGTGLSAVCREYSVPTLITESVRRSMSIPRLVRLLDRVKFGRSRITASVYQVFPDDPSGHTEKLVALYNDARKQFYAKRFDEARKLFRRILRDHPGDGPCRLFAERALYFKKNDKPLQRTVDLKR